MKIILISSLSSNFVIGKHGKIPWSSKTDIEHFKNTTINNSVLMGRKTFESIGGSLKNRLNIVVSRNPKNPQTENLIIKDNIDSAVEFAQSRKFGDLYVIGGGEIFSNTIHFADEMILSHFYLTVDGDTFFPEIDDTIWKVYKAINKEDHEVKFYSKSL